jgi:hypothetical protein
MERRLAKRQRAGDTPMPSVASFEGRGSDSVRLDNITGTSDFSSMHNRAGWFIL